VTPSELSDGTTLESHDGLIVTLLERRDAHDPLCWTCVVLADFYTHGTRSLAGSIIRIVFFHKLVEDDGWRLL
jgi:hypothetical protein